MKDGGGLETHVNVLPRLDVVLVAVALREHKGDLDDPRHTSAAHGGSEDRVDHSRPFDMLQVRAERKPGGHEAGQRRGGVSLRR